MSHQQYLFQQGPICVHTLCSVVNVIPTIFQSSRVYLRNEFDFLTVHGIMNTLGVLRWRRETSYSPPVKKIDTDHPRWYFICGSIVLFRSFVCHDLASVYCCLVVTCWMSWLLFVMFNCVSVTFLCGILG